MVGLRYRLLYAAFGAVLAVSAVGTNVLAQDQTPFTHLFYSATNGRVGYHVDWELQHFDVDMPGGNYEACALHLNGAEVTADLPPGITGPRANSDGGWHVSFEGTPRQVGDWNVVVTLKGLTCGSGPFANVNYGDRKIPVHIHVDP